MLFRSRKLRAMEAGFQAFEADAFASCLERFEAAVRADERKVYRSTLIQLIDATELASEPGGLRVRPVRPNINN